MHIFTLQPWTRWKVFSKMAVAARFGVRLCLEAEFWGVFHPKKIDLVDGSLRPGLALGSDPNGWRERIFCRAAATQKKDPRQKKSVGCCLVSYRFLIDSVNRMMDLFSEQLCTYE